MDTERTSGPPDLFSGVTSVRREASDESLYVGPIEYSQSRADQSLQPTRDGKGSDMYIHNCP